MERFFQGRSKYFTVDLKNLFRAERILRGSKFNVTDTRVGGKHDVLYLVIHPMKSLQSDVYMQKQYKEFYHYIAKKQLTSTGNCVMVSTLVDLKYLFYSTILFCRNWIILL